jgi:hypothetical protein
MKTTRQDNKLIIELEGNTDVALIGTKMDRQVNWHIFHSDHLPEYGKLNTAEHTPELILMAFYVALNNPKFIKFLLNTFGGIDPRTVSDYDSSEVPDKLN